VDDIPANLDLLLDTLEASRFELIVATSGERALELCEANPPDLILLDVMLPGIDGFETCRRLKANERVAHVPVIFMTALTDPMDKLKGFKAGGVDYVTKPIQAEEVKARINIQLTLHQLQLRLERSNQHLEARVDARTADLEEALEEVKVLKQKLERENTWLRSELEDHQPYGDIIGQTPPIKHLITQIELVAPTEASVLILGESGTGKELVAREIHRHSRRADRPIVKLNCSAIPPTLFESELFGHVRGAFTGAVRDRPGRFEAAHGGTLFLDEVGEIPIELQSKLLRVLQEGTYERVGEQLTRTADVRIVAATNRKLRAEIQAGNFREDLYYRLNVFPILVPRLNERRDDVPMLAAHFIERAAVRLGIANPPVPSPEQLERLKMHDWPGNIRELQNTIERAIIMSRAHNALIFEVEHGSESHLHAISQAIHEAAPSVVTEGDAAMTEEQVQQIVQDNTLKALRKANWRVRGTGGAAEILGIKPTTLASRVRRMGLSR